MDWTDGFKALVSYARKAKDPALITQIMEMQSHVILLQNDNEKWQEKARSLEAEIESLKKIAAEEQSREIRNGVYYFGKDQNRFGPCCTRCWDVEKIKVLCNVSTSRYARCPNCDTGYNFESSPPPRRSHGVRY